MSELKEVRDLIDEKCYLNEEFKAAHAKNTNEVKESIDKMGARFDEIEDSINSFKKQQKQSNIVKGFSEDEQKRKQCAEFVKGLRDIACKKIDHFKTDEMKSVMEVKDYNSGDDSAGGVFVMPFLDSELGKLLREFSPIRQMASVLNISTDKYEQIVMNKVNGALWEKDMSDYSTGTKNNTFNKLNMMVQNLHAIAIFSDDLINDSAFDIVGEILTDIAEDIAIAEGLSYWTGNGVGEMTGVLTAPNANNSFDSIERITSAAPTVIGTDDIHELVGAVIDRYLPNAQFRANRAVITTLRQLKDSEGRPLWEPSLQAATPARLAGYPINQATELAATLATDAEALVFGDFRQGTKVIDRMGMTVLRDNLTQYPNIAYKVKKRVTGGVVKGQALKILKQA
jgi:HK97 family phage major capsid protein